MRILLSRSFNVLFSSVFFTCSVD